MKVGQFSENEPVCTVNKAREGEKIKNDGCFGSLKGSGGKTGASILILIIASYSVRFFFLFFFSFSMFSNRRRDAGVRVTS